MRFDVRLQTAGGGVRIMIPEDFCGNCLTPEPYLHSHPTYELHYIRTGSGALLSEQPPLPFSQGQLLLLPPDYLHAIHPDSGEFASMTFLFQPERSGLTAPLDSLLCPEPRCFDDPQAVGSRLLRIRRELLDRHTAYAEVVQGELTALLAELARTLSHAPRPSRLSRQKNTGPPRSKGICWPTGSARTAPAKLWQSSCISLPGRCSGCVCSISAPPSGSCCSGPEWKLPSSGCGAAAFPLRSWHCSWATPPPHPFLPPTSGISATLPPGTAGKFLQNKRKKPEATPPVLLYFT